MNRFFLLFQRTVRIRIEGTEPYRCVNLFLKHNVAYWDLEHTEASVWHCTIFFSQYKEAQRLALDTMCDLCVVSNHGFYQQFYGLGKRLVLLLFLLLTAIWILMMPHFIWTMEVEGNTDVSAERILQELEAMGIGVGTWVTDLPHPRLLKYEMQRRIPELQWIAVNCYGGRATVLVAERKPPQQTVSKKTVCNLVAVRDGVILEMNVLNGFPVCQPGQAVQKGELLVSGFMDHVLTTQATRAYGEVFALTKHEMQAQIPAIQTQKTPIEESGRCIYLNLGKKRIKIFGNSGISVSGCDKIVCEKLVTLPGGETLPIGFTVETYQYYETEQVTMSESWARSLLMQCTDAMLQQELVAGEIRTMDENFTQNGTCYIMTTHAWCREMIARAEEVNFQITREDNDGTDHQRGTN